MYIKIQIFDAKKQFLLCNTKETLVVYYSNMSVYAPDELKRQKNMTIMTHMRKIKKLIFFSFTNAWVVPGEFPYLKNRLNNKKLIYMKLSPLILSRALFVAYYQGGGGGNALCVFFIKKVVIKFTISLVLGFTYL